MSDAYLVPLLLPQSIVKKFEEIQPQKHHRLLSLQKPSTETLVLVPSERCNLHCSYCYEQHKNPQKMTFQTAKIAVQRAFFELGSNKTLKIEFRGGEPFLEFDLIKQICEWSINTYPKDSISFYAITNGTCFHEELKQWLKKHKENFIVPLSIDGDRSTQNHNRSNSFDLIDFDFFLRTWHCPCCITTILPDNVTSVFHDLQFLMIKGFNIRVNFEFTREWTDAQLEQLALGLKRFADYLLSIQSTNRINLFSYSSILDYSIVKNKDEANRRRHFLACNAGRYRKLVVANGSIYPCQAFVPSVFEMSSSLTAGDIFDKLKHEDLHPKKCCYCNFFNLCHICPGFSLGHAGNFKWRNPSLCKITKLRTFLSAYYWCNRMLDEKTKISLQSDDIELLKAAIADLYRGEGIYA